jgi:hypothetical protein
VLDAHNTNLLARQVSCFQGVRPETLYDKFLEEVCALIKSDTWRDDIQKLRMIVKKGDEALYKREKAHLPSFTPCGTFTPSRSVANLVAHNGIIHGDVDHLDDPEVLAEAKRQICADRYTVFCFVSPGGKGLKLGLPIQQPVTTNDAYKHAWQAAADYYRKTYGLVWDKAAKDIARLCFISWDPTIYTNAQADLFPVPAYALPKPSKPYVPPSTPLPQETRERHAQQKIRTAIGIIAEAPDGARHEARLRAGELLGGCVAGGILLSNAEAYDVLAAAAERNTDHRTEALRDLRQAIEHGTKTPIFLADEEEKYQKHVEAHSRPKRQRKRRSEDIGALQEDGLQDVTDWDVVPDVDEAEPSPDAPAQGKGKQVQEKDPYSDMYNARRLVELYGHDLHYCKELGGWLVWNGTYWVRDSESKAVSLAKATARTMVSDARRWMDRINAVREMAAINGTLNDKKAAEFAKQDKAARDFFAHAAKSMQAPRLKAMLYLAQSEPGMEVKQEAFDTDDWLLNVSNGTLDCARHSSEHIAERTC